MEKKLLTREEIIKMADLRIDISDFPPESIKMMNKMVGGDYAAAQEEHYTNIVRGVDMFMTIGAPVEVSNEGKIRETIVTAFGYEHDSNMFKLIFQDGTYFSFGIAGFSAFGSTGAFYGIVNDPDKKSGIRYLNLSKEDNR